jgi:glutamyl-Q tRNA(Asp) synthetase
VGADIYLGRFAPSPTGPLHAGSLVAALASWLDARAHGGQWLVRIEDVDTPRCIPGMDAHILQQLAALGLVPDAAPLYQSQRGSAYQAALDTLLARQRVYPCGCTRQDIAAALAAQGHVRPRHGELVYPGTCRHGLHGKPARAWRFRVVDSEPKEAAAQAGIAPPAPDLIAKQADDTSRVSWTDRRLGPQTQDVATEVGDFVLKRADGLWAYQLAVVVDDAAQGVTHVVRGEDLTDNTARQILLQRALGLPTPAYLHVPLVLGADGEKLSKQNGAVALDTTRAVDALAEAGRVLQLDVTAPAPTAAAWLAAAVAAWAGRFAV